MEAKDFARPKQFPRSKMESNLTMNVKKSEMILDGFRARKDHSTSDMSERGKFHE